MRPYGNEQDRRGCVCCNDHKGGRGRAKAESARVVAEDDPDDAETDRRHLEAEVEIAVDKGRLP